MSTPTHPNNPGPSRNKVDLWDPIFRKPKIPDPPITEDDFRIIAVVKDDLKSLKQLAKTTDWYRFVQPENGCSLLHYAQFYRSKKVFRYLLSIADFPWEHKNRRDRSVLEECLRYYYSKESDRLACQLIRTRMSGDTLRLKEYECLLHFAVQWVHVGATKLLLEMGCDVNAKNEQGATPLYLCVRNVLMGKKTMTEMSLALLYHGADPTQGQLTEYNAFEQAVLFCPYAVQEEIFRFTVDDYTSMEIHIEILLILAKNKSPLFQETVEHTKKPTAGASAHDHYHLFFGLEIPDMNILIMKYPSAIRKLLSEIPSLKYDRRSFNGNVIFQKLNVLLESDLKDATIDLMHNFSRALFKYNFCLKRSWDIERNLFFLLSYGLTLHEKAFNEIYVRHGFDDVVKTLLHMEIKPSFYDRKITSPLLRMLFDVNFELRHVFEAPAHQRNWNMLHLRELLHYFAHAKLREMFRNLYYQPEVPLLVELARNVFRKFLVETFDIKYVSKLNYFVERLPVAPLHKEIIRYEKKLY